MIKKIIFCFFISTSFFLLGSKDVFSQPKVEKTPEVKFGQINFQIRELGSPPTQQRMLEIQIEILNRSIRSTVPPNSIKVLVKPKEVKFPEGAPLTELVLNPEEVTLNLPLAPSTGRVLIIGYSLLEAKPESITFEVQVNPPDGEKKTVKCEGF
jgi:hypothetical protein